MPQMTFRHQTLAHLLVQFPIHMDTIHNCCLHVLFVFVQQIWNDNFSSASHEYLNRCLFQTRTFTHRHILFRKNEDWMCYHLMRKYMYGMLLRYYGTDYIYISRDSISWQMLVFNSHTKICCNSLQWDRFNREFNEFICIRVCCHANVLLNDNIRLTMKLENL